MSKNEDNSKLDFNTISAFFSIPTAILTIYSFFTNNVNAPSMVRICIFVWIVLFILCIFQKKYIYAFLCAVFIFLIFTFFGDGANSQTNKTNSIEPATSINVGDIITFGKYEQDNILENGLEELKWKVLDKREDKILIITTTAIDCQPYNVNKTDVTWESCSLRKWLNGTFYYAAFSSDEQNRIVTTKVTADSNPQYATYPGTDTNDKVFALSLYEVALYLSNDSSRRCVPTAYAVENGAYQSNNGYCWWWLRSPGISSHDAASINTDGSIDYDDGTVSSNKGAVRPAMWIKLK